uniref:Uncharacterized protein MANES_05G119700 n=1 Tax=Rhizophora mucronata TaxID=61149 RepID=A0A2P2MHT2_RHIMU
MQVSLALLCYRSISARLFEVLIFVLFAFLQLLIDNISRPAPNITHLLLKFDLDTPVERTILQPKFHYRCCWVAFIYSYLIPMFV